MGANGPDLGITSLSITLLAALAAGPATGQAADGTEPAEPALEHLVVTGTRLSGPIESIPSFVSVIDKAQIQARQPESTLDLLRSVPGLHVSQPGGRGSVSTVVVRGAEANFTVVLIDGVRVNDPNNSRGGSFDFSTLNVAEIERIEIVRGAQSSIYGSDGLSGVINIITNTGAGERLEATVDAEIGTEKYGRAALTVGGPVGGSSRFAMGLTTVNDGEQVPGNQFENHAFTARFSSDLTEKLLLDLNGRYADTTSESYPEDSGGPDLAVLDAVDRREQERYGVGGRLELEASERLAWITSLSYGEQQERFDSPGVAPGVRDGVPPNFTDSTLKRLDASTYVAMAATDAVSVSAGLDFNRDDGQSVGTVELFPGFELPTDFELRRETVGVFGEVAWRTEDGFAMTASVRHDDPDTAEAETTGRVGAQYAFGTTRVFANWGQGFKLPSFFALGHALVGNPDLKPEKSSNWEIGVAQSLLDGRADFTLTGFDNNFKDLIDFDFDLFTNVNRDEVRTRGFEVAAGLRPADSVQLAAHLSYTDIDVKNSDATLRQRPDWRGGINVDWAPVDSLRVRLDWLYVGEAFDSSIPTGAGTLDSYNRVDSMVSWLPSDKLRVWIAVDNLLDADYEEAIGFPSPGIRARAGLRFTL